jgi:hypothetical protein
VEASVRESARAGLFKAETGAGGALASGLLLPGQRVGGYSRSFASKIYHSNRRTGVAGKVG